MHGDWDPSPFAPSTTAAWPSLAPLILAPKFSSSPSFLPMSLLTLVHPRCPSPTWAHYLCMIYSAQNSSSHLLNT